MNQYSSLTKNKSFHTLWLLFAFSLLILITITAFSLIYYKNTNPFLQSIYTDKKVLKTENSKSDKMALNKVSPPDVIAGKNNINQKNYIEKNIPQMQEVVDASVLILSRSKNTELKDKAQLIIEDFTSQISELKLNYQKAYNLNFPLVIENYQPNMPSFANYIDTEMDKIYISSIANQIKILGEESLEVDFIDNEVKNLVGKFKLKLTQYTNLLEKLEI